MIQDHPRVCGEKLSFAQTYCFLSGSPPRVRGKVKRKNLRVKTEGITPACAGKSIQELTPCLTEKDHPRVCGEKRNSS